MNQQMKFPENTEELEDCRALLEAKKKTARDNISVLYKQMEQWKEALGLYHEMEYILANLKESWSYIDPGKKCSAYFFLNCILQRAVVREFLTEGTPVCKTSDEWQKYKQTADLSRYGAKYEKVPYWITVIPLEEVARYCCETCAMSLPVIEHYVQTEDGPDGDTWMKQHLIFCLKCEKKTVLYTKYADSRF